MTPNLHQIVVIGRYGQGHDPLLTSRSQGQSQGHEGHFRFLAVFANFSYSFDGRVVIFLGQTFQWVCWAYWTMLSDLPSTLRTVPMTPTFHKILIFSNLIFIQIVVFYTIF